MPFGKKTHKSFKCSEKPSSYTVDRNAKDTTPRRAESEQQAREHKTDEEPTCDLDRFRSMGWGKDQEKM